MDNCLTSKCLFSVQDKNNPEKYLQNLYQLYSQTVKLNSELSLYNLGSDNLFLSKLTKVGGGGGGGNGGFIDK
jgi:hypothetical protein